MRKVSVSIFIILSLALFSLICTSLAFANDSASLKNILKSYFNEKNIWITEEKTKEIDICSLWERLGIKESDVSWKDEDKKGQYLFEHSPSKKSRISVYYRIYKSWLTTGTEDEYVILELSQFNSSYQILLFKKNGDDWGYITSCLILDNGGYTLDIEFYETKDKSILFSATETGGHGTEIFSNYWVFYKLVDGKLKSVLRTLKSGYQTGWGILFQREYESEMWPYYYSRPDIGFTYFANFCGDSVYYDSKVQKEPREFLLFSFKKDVVFSWDQDKKEYVIDSKRPQMTMDDIDGLLNDGNDEFYNRYKNELDSAKISGNDRQKEWATVFENVRTGKSETVWDKEKGAYFEVKKEQK